MDERKEKKNVSDRNGVFGIYIIQKIFMTNYFMLKLEAKSEFVLSFFFLSFFFGGVGDSPDSKPLSWRLFPAGHSKTLSTPSSVTPQSHISEAIPKN